MKFKPFLPPLLLFAAVCLVYLNSFWGAFQFDDYNVIVNNPKVHSMSAWIQDFSHGIRPLLKFTYMLNEVSGFGIFGFHLLNLLIHATNSILIYFLALRFIKNIASFRGYENNIALLAALFFAVHPIQTEAVTYISGRSTSLMSMFYLGSMLAYIHGSDTNRRAWLYFYSPVMFVMAVLSKETAVTLPPALLLWERLQPDRDTLKLVIKRQALHWALLLIMLAAIIFHPNYAGLLESGFEIRSIKANMLSQINGITYLVSRIFLINRLNIDPDLPVISSWTPLLAVEAVFLSSLLGAGLLSLKRGPLLGFGILWFFLHLMPTNSIVPRFDIANERQLYLSVWGIFLILAAGITNLQNALKEKKRAIQAGIIILLLMSGYFTAKRSYVYRSEIALWEDTKLKSPGKARVYNNLGYAYALAGKSKEAREAYQTALRLNPDYSTARDNLKALE